MSLKEWLITFLLGCLAVIMGLFTILYVASRNETVEPIKIVPSIEHEVTINYIDYGQSEIKIGKGIVLHYLINYDSFEFHMQNGTILKLDDKDFFELSTRVLNDYEIREKHYGIKKAY